jgi:hypothetical protein
MHRRAWRLEHRTFVHGGVRRTLRLASFAAGWLASADSPSGPTLAADRSLILAAWRALEPMEIDLIEAVAIVGRLPRPEPTTVATRAEEGS